MTEFDRGHRQDPEHTMQGSTSLNTSPEEVWDLITTASAITEWYDSWDAVEYEAADLRLRVGSTFRLTRHRDGRDEAARCRVTVAQAPTRLQWEQSGRDVPTMLVTFEVAADDTVAGRTQLHHTRSWRAR